VAELEHVILFSIIFYIHAVNLSENALPTKYNCDRSIEQRGVGGHIEDMTERIKQSDIKI
jgi:hypothetical protein